jgi:hypothetical protein
VGSNGVTGSEALAAAEKHAALLTARAGARDPSAVPSICRISAALQYNFGMVSRTDIVMCFDSGMLMIFYVINYVNLLYIEVSSLIAECHNFKSILKI